MLYPVRALMEGHPAFSTRSIIESKQIVRIIELPKAMLFHSCYTMEFGYARIKTFSKLMLMAAHVIFNSFCTWLAMWFKTGQFDFLCHGLRKRHSQTRMDGSKSQCHLLTVPWREDRSLSWTVIGDLCQFLKKKPILKSSILTYLRYLTRYLWIKYFYT